jgi:arginase
MQPGTVAVLGIPFDRNSSGQRGAALAPARIREALNSEEGNLCAESGVDLGVVEGWEDLGDLSLTDDPEALGEIEREVGQLLAGGARTIILGGDHSITWPILRAYAKVTTDLTIVQLDAHPDLYDEYKGNRTSHGCPFARIMEEKLADRLVQVGVRSITPHQRQQAERFGVEMLEMKGWRPEHFPEVKGPVYLSLDMDGLDPAYAPGVSHPEPGGLTTREVIGIIHKLEGALVGADIVELNPERDNTGLTAVVAAKFLKEILAGMLAGEYPWH